MSGQRAFVKEREGGPLARGMGWGSRGVQRRVQRPAGLGLAKCSSVWMPLNFLQRFSVGNVGLAGYAAKGGDC